MLTICYIYNVCLCSLKVRQQWVFVHSGSSWFSPTFPTFLNIHVTFWFRYNSVPTNSCIVVKMLPGYISSSLIPQYYYYISTYEKTSPEVLPREAYFPFCENLSWYMIHVELLCKTNQRWQVWYNHSHLTIWIPLSYR